MDGTHINEPTTSVGHVQNEVQAVQSECGECRVDLEKLVENVLLLNRELLEEIKELHTAIENKKEEDQKIIDDLRKYWNEARNRWQQRRPLQSNNALRWRKFVLRIRLTIQQIRLRYEQHRHEERKRSLQQLEEQGRIYRRMSERGMNRMAQRKDQTNFWTRLPGRFRGWNQ